MPTDCQSCGAEIDWAAKFPEEFKDDGKQKMAPVNHDSVDDPAGSLEVWRDPVGPLMSVLWFRYLKKGEEPAPGRHRGISHFATCPNAAAHRTGGTSRPASEAAPERQGELWPAGSHGEAANRGRS